MEIIILVGTGEVGKRDQLKLLKGGFPKESISVVDLRQQPISDLFNRLTFQPLFTQGPRLVIAENVSDKLDLQQLSSQAQELTLILLAEEISSSSILSKSAKQVGAKTTTFEGDKEITAFAYLDYLIEGRNLAFLELKKLLDSFGGVYILSMIYYLLRRNLLPPPTSAFLQKKIAFQKKGLTNADWQRLYELALQTEFNIKVGAINENLALTGLTSDILSIVKKGTVKRMI